MNTQDSGIGNAQQAYTVDAYTIKDPRGNVMEGIDEFVQEMQGLMDALHELRVRDALERERQNDQAQAQPPTGTPTTDIYSFSGGMESAAMLYLCREEIRRTQAHVVWADTGKQLPEMSDSIAQIEAICGLTITRLQPSMTFDEFLFERGGMLRQGYTDCSRRMKRKALREHANSLPRPQRIALGYNADEGQRGHDFCERNDKPDRKFFFPLQTLNVDRAESVKVCDRAGFQILLDMYRKMGRFDCFFCPNQRIAQAEKVMVHYPAQWAEWKAIEKRKGHAILSISAEAIEKRALQADFIEALDRKPQCACFGGKDAWDDDDAPMLHNDQAEPLPPDSERGRH